MGNRNATFRIVQLEDIPTWQTYFEEHEEELINRLPSKGEEFDFDAEINERVSLYEGDITSLHVDGIVSANNSGLNTTGGVSARIETVAGGQLTTELKKLNGCETGEAKSTPGYNLPAKYIVHTAGPSPDWENPSLLESCYRSCLDQMQQHQMKSLAFCNISTGVKGYSQDKAVIVALKTVRQWLDIKKQENKLTDIDRIVFCQYTRGQATLYEEWMQIYFPCCPTIEMDLLPLPGYVKLTVTEPDMLGLDYGRRQAKMPCGHVIGPDAMTENCRDILKKGGFQFFCPSSVTPPCNAQWEYFMVRHVARLTAQELAEFEKKISENYLMKDKGMQRCPGCKTYCYRKEGVGAAVRCPMCTKNTGRNFDFCWRCQGKWMASSSNTPCGNPGCNEIDPRLAILASCPPKEIYACKTCPSIRGCPRCGILIGHKEKCPHMMCTNCLNYGFCFICLKEKKDENWQCPYTGTCVLQPRQTTLPGSK